MKELFKAVGLYTLITVGYAMAFALLSVGQVLSYWIAMLSIAPLVFITCLSLYEQP